MSAQLHRAMSVVGRVLVEGSQQVSKQQDRERLGEMLDRLMKLAPDSVRSELLVSRCSAVEASNLGLAG